jgi:hypothetical protein
MQPEAKPRRIIYPCRWCGQVNVLICPPGHGYCLQCFAEVYIELHVKPDGELAVHMFDRKPGHD